MTAYTTEITTKLLNGNTPAVVNVEIWSFSQKLHTTALYCCSTSSGRFWTSPSLLVPPALTSVRKRYVVQLLPLSSTLHVPVVFHYSTPHKWRQGIAIGIVSVCPKKYLNQIWDLEHSYRNEIHRTIVNVHLIGTKKGPILSISTFLWLLVSSTNLVHQCVTPTTWIWAQASPGYI